MLKRILAVLLVLAMPFIQAIPVKAQAAIGTIGITLESDHFLRGKWNKVTFYSWWYADSLTFGSSLPISDIPPGCDFKFAPVRLLSCEPGSHSFFLFVQENEPAETVSLLATARYGIETNSEELGVVLKNPVGTPAAPPKLSVFPALGKIRTDIWVPLIFTGLTNEEVLGFQLDVKTSTGLAFYGVKLAKEIPGAQLMWPPIGALTHRVIVGAPVDLREGEVLAYLRFSAWDAGIYEFWLNNVTVGTTVLPELINGSVNADFYQLAGQVTYKDSVLPVSGVFAAISEGGLFMETDQQGRYSFGVVPGTATINLSKGFPNTHDTTVITAEDARKTAIECLLPSNPANKVCTPEMSVDYHDEVTPQDMGITLRCAQGINTNEDQCGDWDFEPSNRWSHQVTDDVWFDSIGYQHGDSSHNWPGLGPAAITAANAMTQAELSVSMPDLTVAADTTFVYSITLSGSKITSFGTKIDMGALTILRPEAINVSGVDTFSPSFNSDTHVLDITAFVFEPFADQVVITIQIDEPANSDVIMTRLIVGEHTLIEDEVARGSVTVEGGQQSESVFLPSVVANK